MSCLLYFLLSRCFKGKVECVFRWVLLYILQVGFFKKTQVEFLGRFFYNNPASAQNS